MSSDTVSSDAATPQTPILPLVVRNLSVGFASPGGIARRDGAGARPGVVRDVSFEVSAGECLAIVGESGSGKSVTARSLLGLAGRRAWVEADEIRIAGRSVLGLSETDWRKRRGRDVGLVLQDALVSLDPLRPVGREIADSLRLHTRMGAPERAARVRELLASVGLPDAETRVRQRSGELSGGQRQRALIASALALDPPLLIADEPTTALDVTVQAQILDLLADIKSRGTSIVLISHDLSVVSRIADRVAVMSDGRLIETGPTAEVLGNPATAETRRMIAAVPIGKPRGTRLSAVTLGRPHDGGSMSGSNQPSTAAPAETAGSPRPLALEATELSKTFSLPGGGTRIAVDGVSFQLEQGTTLGIVGESGSGKTTTARLVLGLTAPDRGDVRLLGQPWSELREKERRPLRPSLGAIYQDALSSFDPRLTVGRILGDAAAGPGAGRSQRRSPETERRVAELIDSVGLPRAVLGRRAADMSGGQRQRVGIARALASRPQVLVCDEPVSSLDVTVQAQVLDLLDEVQRELGLSLLFISHDLGVIQHVSDQVAVMRDGRIMETGAAATIFSAPEHPYTQALLGSVPTLS